MTIYYIDSNRGSDANDGINAPWQSLYKLAGAFLPGDEIILADDSSWHLSAEATDKVNITSSGTKEAPLIIRRANTSASYPTIVRNYSVASTEWVWDASNNNWYFPLGTVFTVSSIQPSELILLGSHKDIALRRKDIASVQENRHWFNDTVNKYLYLYAPPGVTPTDYYDSVILGVSGAPALLLSSAKWVVIDGLATNHSGPLVSSYITGAHTDYTNYIRNCKGYRTGMLIRALGTTSAGDMTVEVDNCSSEETAAYAVHAYMTSNIGHRIIVRNSRFLRANMSSSTGGAIYIQTATRNGSWNIIENNYFEETGFALENPEDGAAIYAETGSRRTLVRNNVICNQHLALQDNSGGESSWIANLAINCDRLACITDGGAKGFGVSEYLNNTGILTINKFGYTTRGAGSPVYLGNAVTVTFKNNLLYTKTPSLIPLPIITMSGSPPTLIEDTNAIHGYNTNTYRDGGTDVALTNPVLGNPELTPEGKLTSDSPCKGAGIHSSYRTDISGKQFYNPPSIGAYEYERPRIART